MLLNISVFLAFDAISKVVKLLKYDSTHIGLIEILFCLKFILPIIIYTQKNT